MIRVGTRGSPLARAQAARVAERLDGAVEIVVVRTAGDAEGGPIRSLADGAFVTALEDALRHGAIDVAVHSLKDLPTGERPGLSLAAVPERADPRDVLVTRARGGLASLPTGARVGTGSARRAGQLRLARPDVETADIRGNVETRISKVASGEYDATVLALAGLRRLGVSVDDHEILALETMLPAPGQGAIAVQCRADDAATRSRVARLDDPAVRAAVDTERELLRLLGGSCDLALGAHARVLQGMIALSAVLAEGAPRRARARGNDPQAVARDAARDLEAQRV